MERERWERVYRLLVQLDKRLARGLFCDALIVAVYFWAVIHDRPVIGRSLPDASDVDFKLVDMQDRGSYLQNFGLVRNKPAGEELPTLFFHPKDWNGEVVLWVAPEGSRNSTTLWWCVAALSSTFALFGKPANSANPRESGYFGAVAGSMRWVRDFPRSLLTSTHSQTRAASPIRGHSRDSRARNCKTRTQSLSEYWHRHKS